MNNPRDMAAAIAGALIGGVAGYLFFTNRGRSARLQIERTLDDFSRDLADFQHAVRKATGAANEGWKLLNDALGESEKPGQVN